MKNTFSLALFLMVLILVPNVWAQDFVVVKRNAKFFSAPTGSKVFSQNKGAEGFFTFELLEEKGERVQVRVAQEKEETCYSTNILATPVAELRLWVSRKSLEKVTTEPISWIFNDGSEVEVAAGMVLKGRNTVLTKNASIFLTVPKEKIGRSFQKKYLEVSQTKRTSHWISEKGIRFNNRRFFKRKIFKDIEILGAFAQSKNKCIRIKGKFRAQRLRFETIAEAEKLRGASKKIKSGSAQTTTFIDGKIQTKELEEARKFEGLLSSIHKKDNENRKPDRIGKVKIEALKISGFHTAVMEKKMRSAVEKSLSCYRMGRYKNTNLKGSVTLQIKVGTDGKVQEKKLIKSSLFDSVAEGCVRFVLGRTQFESPSIERTVNVTLKYWQESTDKSPFR